MSCCVLTQARVPSIMRRFSLSDAMNHVNFFPSCLVVVIFAKKNVLHCLKLHQSRSIRRSEKLEERRVEKKVETSEQVEIITNWLVPLE